MTICLQTELSSAMIQPSIYQKILIDITLEFEWATVLAKELNTRENVFRSFFKQKVFTPLFFSESTVTGIVYSDILEEFLMPVLEKRGPDDMLF
jgi:hypothetical protein